MTRRIGGLPLPEPSKLRPTSPETNGAKDFSDDFAAVTTAPVHGKMTHLRLFIDKSSIEAFDAEGRMAMTNLVFPTKPYNKVVIKGKGKYAVYNLK